ncbi:MAG: hypothetical protein HY259_04675 [Chloroflexi bacterium]|nr:hypothetical protein [Chloroflexota bacterium]
MVFRVGDKVVHPSHGAGVICGIETHAVTTDSASSYYVISLMAATTRRVLVPVNNVVNIGLRSAMARNKTGEVLEVLDSRPISLSNNFTERQAHLSQHVRSGNPREWAEVLRNLFWRGQKKKLSATDQEYYNRARDMLAGEIALAEGCTIDQAVKQIEARLRARFDS